MYKRIICESHNTVGIHPTELANHDQGFADGKVLHVNIDGSCDCVGRANQEDLEENLSKS